MFLLLYSLINTVFCCVILLVFLKPCVCMCLCAAMYKQMQELTEARRGHCISWGRNYGQLWTALHPWWKLNLGHLQEQEAPSMLSHVSSLFRVISCGLICVFPWLNCRVSFHVLTGHFYDFEKYLLRSFTLSLRGLFVMCVLTAFWTLSWCFAFTHKRLVLQPCFIIVKKHCITFSVLSYVLFVWG